MKKLLLAAGACCVLLALALAAARSFYPQGSGKLTWNRPVVKKSVQTFAYKVYANSKLENGRFFLSKLVLKNEGSGAVRDFSIAYEIPSYIPLTTPVVLPEIPVGHTVIDLFYPQLPDRVTKIKNLTAATLELHLKWRETADGPLREEVLRENFNFRGVNEIEYTDLPAEEVVTQNDLFANDMLCAAMVTPNDPVVAEYAAAVTERLGGAVAGAGGVREAVEVMRGLYEYMTTTGMRYAGAQGVPENVGNVQTMVQTVRLPRDVITTNNGLCIELALLWVSVLEHLGIHSYLEMIPGHAFVTVESGGNVIPLECTSITPKAVGAERAVSFEESVKMASKTLDQVIQSGAFHHELDIQKLQLAGIRPPELPDVDQDRIKSMLASRNPPRGAAAGGGDAVPNAQIPQNAGKGSGQLPAGFQSYTDPNNLVQLGYPGDWLHGAPNNGRIPQLVFGAYGGARSPIGIEVYHTPGTVDPDAALRVIASSYRHMGVKVEAVKREPKQGFICFVGKSSGKGLNNVWIGFFKPTDRGCIGVCYGVPAQSFNANQSTLAQLLNYVRFL